MKLRHSELIWRVLWRNGYNVDSGTNSTTYLLCDLGKVIELSWTLILSSGKLGL